jgi:hypothetical protein
MNRPRKSRQSIEDEPSPTFEEDYLDIDHWPQGWRVDSEDIVLGQIMVDLFNVFFVHQLNLARSRKTLRLHRDNLRTLEDTSSDSCMKNRRYESAGSSECCSKPSMTTEGPSFIRL